jgi:phosphoglycolate phosphatase-like HAD superfamily hydrolase
MIDLKQYQTIIFDCDGVVLNSNFQKIEAYRNTALKFGATQDQAQALVDHHISLTGVSRYVKFDHFLKEIIKTDVTEEKKNFLVKTLNNEVVNLLANCEIAGGLNQLREIYAGQKWMVASGGDQEELRYLFRQKNIDRFFDQGIFGSPRSKHEIIEQEIKVSSFPVVFLGDSKYDIETAEKFNFDFIFVSGWTDLEDWQNICQEKNLKTIEYISDLKN